MIAAPHHTIEILRTRFVMEPMPMMRDEILSALADVDGGLVPFLLALLDDAAPAARASCLEGLCRFDDERMIDAVRPYLDDPHPNLRRLAVVILWQFPPERPSVRPVVYELFPSMKEDDYRHLPVPNRASYLVGIRTVGDIGLESAVPALQEGLGWDDPQVRLECACSLFHLDCQDGAGELRGRIASGDQEARRRAERLKIDNRAFFG